jgi:hypothetical protein
MKKFLAGLAVLASSAAAFGGEKGQDGKAQDAKAEVVVVKPSRYRVVTSPVEVLKTEVVTKTSAVPATLVVEEKRGLFGRYRPVKSVVVIEQKK